MHYRNIKILVVILVACIGFPSLNWAQIEVSSGDTEPYTPINMIEEVFLGSGLEINGIQFSGLDRSVGVFSNASQYIGLEQGIVLSTGFAETVAEFNDDDSRAQGKTSGTSITDQDLQEIAGVDSDILDVVSYEIKFIPESDTIRFRYVFASEEYPEFVCSNFNDVFGFFITGANPSGGEYDALNLAQVPDPADQSGTTFLNYNVAINSVNNGSLGFLGSINIDNCSGASGSLDFSEYYNPVDPGDFPVFDAYLDVFIAQAAVVPCTEYTIKLAIGDVKDDDFDSAVFLEAASFYSPTTNVLVNTESPDGAIAEGCSPVELEFNIPFPLNEELEIDVAPLSEGQFPDQARNNDDYAFPSDKIIIPAGATSATLSIDAIEDNNPEIDEFIYLDFQRSFCRRDTIKIKIKENQLPMVILPGDTSLCGNDILRINPEFEPELEVSEPQVFRNNNLLVIGVSDELYSSIINVQDVPVDIINPSIFTKVCIDTLVTRTLTDIELFLVPPQGQILELSTNNGLRNKPTSCATDPYSINCIDSLKNTCFTVDASQNINNGNAVLGSIYPGNNVYEGEYLPEGDWNQIFNGAIPANGSWELLIKSDSVSVQDVASQKSLLESWSIHFEAGYSVTPRWSPNFDILCTDCFFTSVSPDSNVTYKFRVTDSYGCQNEEDIRITALPVPETPEIIENCIVINPSSIQINWEDSGPDVEFYQVYPSLDATPYETTETTFTFEGLASGTDHVFYVSAFNGECYTALDSITTCSTPPCTGIEPNIGMVTTVPPTCDGRNDGQLFAQASTTSGGELTYYIETLSNNTGEFNFLMEGSYLLRVVDEFGCSTVQNVVVPPAEDIQFEIGGSGISCVGMSDAVAEINITEVDNAPYTILWQNASEDFIQSDLGMGTYFFTITDGGGCKYEKSIEILDPDPLIFANIDAQLPNCFGDDGSIELTMDGGTGAYTYSWEDTSVNEAIVTFPPGNYSVTVSDVNDCSVDTEIEIKEREEINLIPDTLQAVCIGELSQEIELNIEGGEPGFTVDWDGVIQGVEVVDVSVGFYELTITDSNNCIIIDSLEIINYPDLIVEFDIRDPRCFNIEDGIISIASTEFADGSNGVLNGIIWDNGETAEAIGNLMGDKYYPYVITDGFGCKHIDSVYLPSPPAIFANVDTINLLACFGDQNGSFSINPTGGIGELNTEWSTNIPNLSGNTASELGVGVYGVTITDDECELAVEFDLQEPDELVYNPSIGDVNCFGEESGEILGEVEGGIAPYILSWSTGSNLDSLVNLASGNYDVSITDANGCTFEASYEITQPEEALIIDYQTFEPDCFGEASGSLEIEATGGTLPYNILVDSINYFDNLFVTGLTAGFHNLTVIDGGGCIIEIEDVFIPETDEIFVTLPSDTTIEFGSSITLEFLTNSTELINYSWEISSPEVEPTCIECPNPIIESVETDFFVILTARDSTCKYVTEQQWIFARDESSVHVPTGFSPNGDNRNDRLQIFGNPGVLIINFEIYNRWGELIHADSDFEINDMANSGSRFWDGTFNGEEVDSGVYTWRITWQKRRGDIMFSEGSTTLLR